MIDFSALLPPAVTADPQMTALELPRAVLMRVNFIPGVRQRLGWRGVKECSGNPDALTLKIVDAPGVFAICPQSSEMDEEQGHALFDLCYFPAPEEEVLETFSIAAGIVALRDDFLGRVREFGSDEQLQTLFKLASLQLNYNHKTGAVAISLIAAERQVLISAEGVMIDGTDGLQQALEPNGVDQNLAAFSIIAPFFRALSASFSFCFSAAPNAINRRSRPGQKITYYRHNHFESETCQASKEIRLSLVWGEQRGLLMGDQEFPDLELNWRAPEKRPHEYANEPWWQEQVPGARFSVDKNTMGITDRPKLIILTGFLGSGKTSFLNHFIEDQAERNAFVAIVQNEIGAKSLDTHLLGQHYAVTEMDEGCICCTLSGNLKIALTEIVSGFQPDFVVVETTGLANPANFLNEVSELEEQLDFCSITTVIDASQGLSTLQNYGVAREQVILADVILLNKVDTLSPEGLESLEKEILRLNPFATVHHGNHGDFSAPELYGINLTGNGRLDNSLKRIRQTEHDTHCHYNISTALAEFKAPVDKETFLSKTAQLSDKVLRIKGILQFTDHDDHFYYQYVPGSHRLTPAQENTSDDNFLVIIGEDIENSAKSLLTMADH